MAATDRGDPTAAGPGRRRRWRLLRRHPLAALGALILLAMVGAAVLAPLIAPYDPQAMNPVDRLLPPSASHLFGTDQFGRDIFSRAIYGGRASMTVALAVALLATLAGVLIGAAAGFFRLADAVLMRAMDGIMAIPGILLAVALMALSKPSLTVAVIAIAIPEVPRMSRLVRSSVLTIREQTYVEAATTIGVPFGRLMLRYILPNAMAPLIVQATYVCASAVILESYLSFLGVGLPPEVPSWGNLIAGGRLYLQIAPWNVIYPGVQLAVMVLSINLLGDGLRDAIDPRLGRRR
jgi:peptide/nickel transport system permease protein